MTAFDSRLVKVGIQIADQFFVYNEQLDIRARGTKYRGGIMNTCDLTISNLTREHRQQILTQSSPILRTNRQPIIITLDVGRESYGTFQLFYGMVFTGSATQPPDIGLNFTSLTNNFAMSNTVAINQSGAADVKVIAQQVADANGLALDCKTSPKQIDNYSCTGSPPQHIDKLNDFGGILAYVDNKTLHVTDADKPRDDTIRLVNAQTGMVGVPQPTVNGVLVQVMIDNTIFIGTKIRINSAINPGCNGDYIVQKMDFEIASRDTPFWYILTCVSTQLYTGGTQ